MTKLEQKARAAAVRWLEGELGLSGPSAEASLGALISQFAYAHGATSDAPDAPEPLKENAIATASYHCAVAAIDSLRREAGYEKVNHGPLSGVGLLQSILLRFAYAYAARIEADRARIRGIL